LLGNQLCKLNAVGTEIKANTNTIMSIRLNKKGTHCPALSSHRHVA